MTRGSVWWVEFDPAVGSEIHKTRPAKIAVLSDNDMVSLENAMKRFLDLK